MKALNLVALAIVAASTTACSTTLRAPASGFLSSQPPVVATSPTSASSDTPVREAVNPALVTVSEVVWQAGERSNVSAQEQLQLQQSLRAALQSTIQGMPAAAGGRAAVVRAAITRVETVSPLLNTASLLLVFMPLDSGGAAVEIEAVDPVTGEQLATHVTGYRAPMTQLKARFNKLGSAEIALQKAAASFVPVLAAAGAP